MASSLGHHELRCTREEHGKLRIDIGAIQLGHDHIEAASPHQRGQFSDDAQGESASFPILVNRDALALKKWSEKIVLRKICEHLHCMTAALEPASQPDDLTLRTAAAEMIDYEKYFDGD
jgi:hypothetical protein